MENKYHISFIRSLIATVAFLLSFTAFAQGSFSVKLKLVDSKTSEPVSFATVSLTVKGENKPAKYVLSDINGDASLTKVRKNETKNRPIQLAEKATTFLEGIDTHILLKMNDSELRRLSRQLDKLEQVIGQIRENL
jgi:hypothetical protein